MGSRTDKILFNLMLRTGSYLLESMRNRMSDSVDDVKSRAYDTYDIASDRVRRAADVIRGTDRPSVSPVVAGLAGLGIGVGIGLLMAPARGEETRSKIASKARDISVEPPPGACSRTQVRETATDTLGRGIQTRSSPGSFAPHGTAACQEDREGGSPSPEQCCRRRGLLERLLVQLMLQATGPDNRLLVALP